MLKKKCPHIIHFSAHFCHVTSLPFFIWSLKCITLILINTNLKDDFYLHQSFLEILSLYSVLITVTDSKFLNQHFQKFLCYLWIKNAEFLTDDVKQDSSLCQVTENPERSKFSNTVNHSYKLTGCRNIQCKFIGFRKLRNLETSWLQKIKGLIKTVCNFSFLQCSPFNRKSFHMLLRSASSPGASRCNNNRISWTALSCTI